MDLKHPEETWEIAFDNFLANAPEKVHHILSGIPYFHDCESAAWQSSTPYDILEQDNRVDGDKHELSEDVASNNSSTDMLMEEGLESLLQNQGTPQEELHARITVETAWHAQIFHEDEDNWEVAADSKLPTPVSGDKMAKLLEWKERMNQDINKQNVTVGVSWDPTGDKGITTEGVSVECIKVSGPDDEGRVTYIPLGAEISAGVLPPIDPSMLKDNQFWAYDIVTWHLDQTLGRAKPPPLRMLLHGEGGIGKSKVIQMITEYLERRGAKHLLLKAAYMGVAVSLIRGKTTHTIGMISQSSVKNGTVSRETQAKLQEFCKNYTYLIIDEISIIGKTVFSLLSRMISIVKTGEASSVQSSGGASVIICGDFHQLLLEGLLMPSTTPNMHCCDALGSQQYIFFMTLMITFLEVSCSRAVGWGWPSEGIGSHNKSMVAKDGTGHEINSWYT